MEHIETRQVDGHTIEIYDLGAKRSRTGKAIERYVGKLDGQWDWTERRNRLDVVRALTAQVTPDVPAVKTPTRGWSKYSRPSDTVGEYMRDSFGLTSPAAARGECHFCGQPLNRRGYCDECQ